MCLLEDWWKINTSYKVPSPPSSLHEDQASWIQLAAHTKNREKYWGLMKQVQNENSICSKYTTPNASSIKEEIHNRSTVQQAFLGTRFVTGALNQSFSCTAPLWLCVCPPAHISLPHNCPSHFQSLRRASPDVWHATASCIIFWPFHPNAHKCTFLTPNYALLRIVSMHPLDCISP